MLEFISYSALNSVFAAFQKGNNRIYSTNILISFGKLRNFSPVEQNNWCIRMSWFAKYMTKIYTDALQCGKICETKIRLDTTRSNTSDKSSITRVFMSCNTNKWNEIFVHHSINSIEFISLKTLEQTEKTVQWILNSLMNVWIIERWVY